MTNVFLAGYTLFITSYLGDADYYDTKTVTGLTLEQAQAVEKFVRLCVSGYRYPNSVYNENGDGFDSEKVAKHLSKEELWLLAEVVFSKPSVPEDAEVLKQDLSDILIELMGYSDPYNDQLRVFDSLKVAYFERDKHLQSTLIGA